MSFPTSIPSYAGFTSGHTLQADNHASQHNSEQTDITALGTKVGTGSSTSTNNTVLRGNGTGTSTWAQVNLTTDVTGTLPTSLGGTGTTSTTGTGSVVFSASPTITGTVGGSATYSTPTLTQPTITNFSSATHDHSNTTNGGTLANNIITNAMLSTSATEVGGAWQTWTPTWAGFSAAPTGTGTYKQVGKTVYCNLKPPTGTSNATNQTFTLPIVPTVRSGWVGDFVVRVTDNGVNAVGLLELLAGNNVATVYKDVTGAAFTSSGAKNVMCAFFYEVD